MTISVKDISFWTQFSGLHNFKTVDFSVTIPAQNIGVSSYVEYTASTAMTRNEALNQMTIQYSGIETNKRILDGVVIVNKPVYNAADYQLLSVSWYASGTLYVKTIISNQTGGTVAIPQIIVNCSASLFLVPF